MRNILLILFLALLVAPVPGQLVTYTAPTGKVIWALDIVVPPGSTGTISITQSDGTLTSGTWSYTSTVPGAYTMTAQLGSSAPYSFTYFGPAQPLTMSVWNGDNYTLSRQLELGYGQVKGVWNGVVKTTIKGVPVSSYAINSGSQITVTNELQSYSTAVENLNPSKGFAQYWSDFWALMPIMWGVFENAFYWLKFLFIDNLMLTVLLYLFGTAAYAANSSRNIFVFYKTWFRQQVGLFNFFVNGFSTALSIIGQIVSTAGNAVGSVLSMFMK